MNPGELNRRIEFYKLQEAENKSAILEQEPGLLFSVWASIKGSRGREYYESQRINNENTYKIKVRYRSDITADMLIKYGADFYDINSIVDLDMKHEFFEIYCTVKKRGGINHG